MSLSWLRKHITWKTTNSFINHFTMCFEIASQESGYPPHQTEDKNNSSFGLWINSPVLKQRQVQTWTKPIQWHHGQNNNKINISLSFNVQLVAVNLIRKLISHKSPSISTPFLSLNRWVIFIFPVSLKSRPTSIVQQQHPINLVEKPVLGYRIKIHILGPVTNTRCYWNSPGHRL